MRKLASGLSDDGCGNVLKGLGLLEKRNIAFTTHMRGDAQIRRSFGLIYLYGYFSVPTRP